VLTIELELATRRIRQARRRCNAAPSASERSILSVWAERERLVVGEPL
jgi:hypothetical protein